MAMFELFDELGDSGFVVIGTSVDQTFRREADEAGRPDERLVTVRPEDLLEETSLKIAAAGGLLAAVNTVELVEVF